VFTAWKKFLSEIDLIKQIKMDRIFQPVYLGGFKFLVQQDY